MFMFLAMIFTACASAATPTPTHEVVDKPTQTPTQKPIVVVPTIISTVVPTIIPTVVPTIVPTVVLTKNPTEVQSGMMSLMDTIKADERLSLFYEALMLSGAVDFLKGDGPFTIFAPTNDAIKAVPNLNSMDQYGKTILNHILSGKLMTADLSLDKLNMAFTESGEPVTITVEEGVVHLHTVNNANAVVITADIETSDGVLYVIDRMLLLQTK